MCKREYSVAISGPWSQFCTSETRRGGSQDTGETSLWADPAESGGVWKSTGGLLRKQHTPWPGAERHLCALAKTSELEGGWSRVCKEQVVRKDQESPDR